MRLRHPDGQLIHLSYCTNVHAAEDLDGIIDQFDRYAVPVRERLGSDVLGLGLWLAAPVAAGLAGDPELRRRLRRELTARGLEVVTLNGFPYQSFQAPVVKQAVYHPDWTRPERLDVHPRPGPDPGRPAPRRRGPRIDLHAAVGLA